MLAFEVFINNERICVAGIENWAVLSCILAGHRPNGEEKIDLSVGGLTEDDAEGVSHHVDWGRGQIEVGSTIKINVIEVENTDAPRHRYRSDAEVQESPFTPEELEALERADYLRLKAKFDPEGGS
jgi:hypothetical protein